MQHSAQGTVGLLLNRPTGMVMRPGKGGLRYAIIGAPEGMQTVFGDNRWGDCGWEEVDFWVATHTTCAYVRCRHLPPTLHASCMQCIC